MAIRPDYNIGTVTLVASSANFTTTGSSLQTAAVQAGDAIITPSGHVLIIASITGQNSGTLFLPCPAGAAGANLPLRIRFQPDGSRYQGAVRNLVDLLSSGNIEAFAALVGSAGLVPIFTGVGTMDLADPATFGLQDPTGSLGKLAALELGNRQILQTDGAGNLTAIALAARQILQTDANGALKAIALAANKFLRTDENGDLALSDLGTAAIALLNLAGTATADRVPYLTSANAAGLATLTAYARTALAATNEAAARTIMGANRPMFCAFASGDVGISNGAYTGVPLSTVTVNVGNAWNGTRFLCAEAGNYFFSFSAQWNGGSSNTGFGTARIKKNGVASANFGASKTLFFNPITVQAIMPLAVGDTVLFEFVLNDAAGGGIILQGGNTSGTGFLIR